MKVKVLNKSGYPLPEYHTKGSSGMDLKANISDQISIQPGMQYLMPTGLHIKIPEGYEGQLRPRSGLALKHEVTITNSPGTIDSDYTGEIKVIIRNASKIHWLQINPGDRIAQLVFQKVERAEFEEVDSLEETERSDGGFGHTGI